MQTHPLYSPYIATLESDIFSGEGDDIGGSPMDGLSPSSDVTEGVDGFGEGGGGGEEEEEGEIYDPSSAPEDEGRDISRPSTKERPRTADSQGSFKQEPSVKDLHFHRGDSDTKGKYLDVHLQIKLDVLKVDDVSHDLLCHFTSLHSISSYLFVFPSPLDDQRQ